MFIGNLETYSWHPRLNTMHSCMCFINSNWDKWKLQTKREREMLFLEEIAISYLADKSMGLKGDEKFKDHKN